MNLDQRFNIDNLRFIDNLHTTNRQLSICSNIVRELKDRQVPKSILVNKLVKWSVEQEATNAIYNGDKGKITDKGKPTTAISHYLKLSESLSLVTKFSDVYSATRISYVLSYFIGNSFNLSIAEKLFYAYQLINIDADGIILVLQILSNQSSINQRDFQKLYSEGLANRLQYKRQLSSGSAKFNIANKLRKVQLLWKSPIKYAEHMIAPRSEWLKTIGLVDIKRSGGATIYTITSLGRDIFEQLPDFNLETTGKDVNNKWIEDHFFSIFGMMDPKAREIRRDALDEENILEAFSVALLNIKSSNLFRLPLLDTFLFICIYMLGNHSIKTNLADLTFFFKDGLLFRGKKFFVRGSGRINESYITSILC